LKQTRQKNSLELGPVAPDRSARSGAILCGKLVVDRGDRQGQQRGAYHAPS
jgi:hypothetical protein